MTKHIKVPYNRQQNDVTVDVTYSIDLDEDIQQITCTVTRGEDNAWLQLYKFVCRSVAIKGVYTRLFYDNGNIKNVDTSLFIDKTYGLIMKKERLQVEME